MIPKIIHYCWFGGNPLPELAQKCIASWKKYCPDYEIREWNESNFDLNYNDYVREAYEAKKWAFVSDVARLYALVNYGGIYMDTDLELLKPIDRFLEHEAVSGFESTTQIQTALMGCLAHFPLFEEFLHDYDQTHFTKNDGTLDVTTNVARMTDKLLKQGLQCNNRLQTICGFTLYPNEYFCPMDAMSKELNLTENTYSIHHYDGSWQSEELKKYRRYYSRMYHEMKRFLPDSVASLTAKFIARARSFGIRKAMKKARGYIRSRRT